MEDRIKIRKIHIMSLMETLAEIWDRGVDYVDIHGMEEDGQDTIYISFSKGYMNEEYSDDFDMFGNEQFSSKIDVKLSDEDLNQLL